MNIAIVTGASSGMGREFVRQLSDYVAVEEVWVIARREAALYELKNECPVPVRPVVLDLCKENSFDSLGALLAQEKPEVSLLVNAAGADIQKGVSAYTQEKIAFQCRVNFEAAVSLCKFALEYRAEELEIINVSSVSGLYPMPYFAIYSATKSALTSFSIALRQETKKKGVRVTAVLPGAMPTRADIKEQIKGQGLWGKLAVKSPEWVAEYSIKAVKKNKAKTIPGFWNKAMRFFTAWIPLSWKIRFIAKRWSKITKDSF